MSDIVLGIRMTADGKAVVSEFRSVEDAQRRLSQGAQQSSDTFVAGLKKQADTLGMTKRETLAYEASQRQLTEAQKQSVAQSILAIEAHERQASALTRVKVAAAALGAAI